MQNLFELAHCMLCKKTEDLKVIGHHRDGLIVGFFFVCSGCIDIVANGELRWDLIPCKKGMETLKGLVQGG